MNEIKDTEELSKQEANQARMDIERLPNQHYREVEESFRRMEREMQNRTSRSTAAQKVPGVGDGSAGNWSA